MNATTRLLFLPLLLLLAPGAALAQRNAGIPDPDPEVERRSFQVAEGFEVNLFASDPLLAKPIQMNFDAAGRLWLASSETYPQIKPGQKANDKIVILEDTRGVGKADKVTVFADGLLIPTGLEPGPYKGEPGVFVANSTDLLHLADPRGEGKATRRRVVLSGFGTEDTHHLLHTLRWGNDGNLYFNQSVYIHSHIETPHGVRRLGGGGIWQFRPDTLQLEVFMRGMWNGWGHHFDTWGQSFATDGAGGEGVIPVVPGASYVPAPGRVLHGLNIPSPKYCGLEIVSGRHLPDDWQGNLLTNDFRANRVCRFVLAPAGSSYTARLMPDLIRATHPAFRPIDVKMGPDGAIYVADWYNPIIQHGEVDFRDPRRDVTHGRIWRVTAKGRPLVARPKLAGATVPELLDALKAPEGWTRHFAHRILQDRGVEVLPELRAWVARLGNEKKDDLYRLEALWTYQALATVEPALLAALLESRDYRIRAAAVRVCGAWQDRLPNRLELLAARAVDEEPQVRLEAVRALGGVPGARSVEVALTALDRPLDTSLDYALWLTVRERSADWVPAFQAGTFQPGNTARLLYALQAVGTEQVLPALVGLLKAGKIPAESEERVLTLLASIGGPGELGLILDRVLALKDPEQQTHLLATLADTVRQRGVQPAGERKRLLGLIEKGDERVRAAAARLAGLVNLTEARPALAALAQDGKSPAELRLAAVEALGSLKDPACVPVLRELAEKGDGAVRRRALCALAGRDLSAAAKSAPSVLSECKGGEGAAEVFDAFVQRKNGTALLARALEGQSLPADVARVGVRAVRSSGRDGQPLVEALTRAGKLTFGARALGEKEMKEFVADVARLGNAARGEQVFRRADQLCLRCHAIAGAGGQVGPDLSSIGASAPADYLVDSLLVPSKAIKENYNALLVTTVQGQQFTGIKVRQTPTALVLRSDQDREITIPLKDVEEQTPSKVSLMPEGLIDTLTRGELLDLVRFLSELGKVGPYSAGKERLARRWEVLDFTPASLAAVSKNGATPRLARDPKLTWSSAYATVAGTLPLAEVPAIRPLDGAVSLVQATLEAAAPARVRLKVADPTGLTLWLDDERLQVSSVIEVDLPAGKHALTMAVDRAIRREGLRCEIEDGPASAGVRFVGGK